MGKAETRPTPRGIIPHQDESEAHRARLTTKGGDKHVPAFAL